MNLNISIVQTDLHWEKASQNLAMLAKKIRDINHPTDIIVLPEMFTTGFSMNSLKLAEPMSGETIAWMKCMAKKKKAVITGSLIIKARNKYYNRLAWVQPEGEVYTYDKRHLFRMAKEHRHFSAGENRLIINYKGWRICPLICYDLRFPVWSRNRALTIDHVSGSHKSIANKGAYDVLIYIANWPAARKQPWSKLLEARAIENQCYVVGVNRVGEDENEIEYSGNSVVINPKGEAITNIEENTNAIGLASLSLDELTAFRKKFPVDLDGDKFTLGCSN